MFRMKAPSFGLSQVPDRKSTDQWLFLARHLGLPTRLLDWTENALLALYFAIHADESDEPIVWMLDPFALNELSISDHPEREQSGSAQFPLTWFRPEHKINIGHENIRGAWEENRQGVEIPVAVQKWLRKSEQGDKWNRCLIEGMKVLSETGARDEQTTPP